MVPVSATAARRPGDAPGTPRAAMGHEARDLRRFTRAKVLATIMVTALGAGVAMTSQRSGGPTRPETPLTAQAPAAPITSPEEFLAAVGTRRELASLPLLLSDPSLQISAQGWADNLAGRGVGHDPQILDGVADDWEQVAELVSSGPSFDAASRALLAKAAGASALDDPKVTAFGLGNRVDDGTTILVVRLLRTPNVGDVGVQMGF